MPHPSGEVKKIVEAYLNSPSTHVPLRLGVQKEK